MTAALALAPFSPTTAQESYRPPFSFERTHSTVIVHADGTHEHLMESTMRIESELGVNEHGQRILSFNAALEELDILEAATITPSGQRVAVEPNAIRTVEEELSGGAPMFSDMKNKVVVYPDVRVGSRLYLKARSRQHSPHFGHEFFMHDVFSPHERHDHVSYHVMVHPSVVLHTSVLGVQGGEITPSAAEAASGPAGYRHYRYTYQQSFAYPREPGQIPYGYFAPHLMLTTFHDYLDLGKSYQNYAAPKVRVTAAVQALAGEITQGSRSAAEDIQRLYEWVARNIRYVAIYLGDGGFEPHDTDTILKNRYGDCKDHVVLLQALLLARGIDTSPALINAGAGETLSPVAVPFPFDHVILYVPSLNLYLDPTAQFAPFGVLPDALLNKPVLLTALQRLDRTPRMVAQDHQTTSTVRIDVLPDGRLRGVSTTTYRGSPEFEARGRHFDREGRSPERTVRNLLARFNEMGFGVIADSDAADITRPFELSSRFELDPPVNVPGPSAMMVPVGLAPGRIANIGYTKPIAARRFPVGCNSEEIKERVEIRFPSSVRVTRLPQGVRFHNEIVRYASVYTLADLPDGQLLTVTRHLVTQYESGTCGPQQTLRWQEFHPVLYRDIRAQIFID